MQEPSTLMRVRRGLFAVGAVLFVGSGLAAFAPVASSPAAAADGTLGVVVSDTTDLLDGQAIDVEVTAPAGRDLLSVVGAVRICRDGPTYATEPDLQFAAGNCPDVPISSSGSGSNHAGLYVRPDLRSAVGTYRVGVGTVSWSRGEVSHELSCDTEHPCRLVVNVRLSNGEVVVDGSTLLTFSDSSPLASCGGSATDALDTGGPDRYIDTWARWTRRNCEVTKDKAATNALFAGEGLGLDAFHAGDADLVYSATGAAIPGRRARSEARPALVVPIGVNAAVFALVGGYPDPGASDWPIGLRRPYSDVRVKVSELASLFGQGVHGFNATGSSEAVLTRNPQIANVNGVGGPVQAPASSDATTYFTTRWFDTRAGDVWLTSPILEPPKQPRGIVDELSAATPPFATFSMNMYSSRATLKKLIADDAQKTLDYALTWVLTDLATAEQLGLPVARIENGRGEFVAPTDESLAAAVAGMERRPDGTVLPGTGADAPGAYPLTFVEHVVVAAEPDCTGTTHRRVVDWVDFITGEGQKSLVGVRPLAGDLAKASASARATLAKACDAVPPVPNPETPTPPTPEPPGVLPADPGGLPGDGSSFGPDDLGADVPTGEVEDASGTGDDGTDGKDDARSAADDPDAVAEAAAGDLPPLAGRPGTRTAAGVASLLGLAFMGAGAGSLGRGRVNLLGGPR